MSRQNPHKLYLPPVITIRYQKIVKAWFQCLNTSIFTPDLIREEFQISTNNYTKK